ncbi:MAG TPA: hypothetical protein VJ717_16680, partial [Gemmatimonadaceae bacterium]|nr:hypothetical protein [Gemmatimonadaceae bacterium]
AAVVVHTSLTNDAMSKPALALFEAREKAIYEALEQQRVALAQAAVTTETSEFWSARRERDVLDGGPPNEDVDIETVRRDADVQAAFAALKQRDSITLARGAEVERSMLPTVRDNLVVLEERITSPLMATPIRHARGVNLVTLLDLAPAASQVPDLYDVYCKNEGAVPLGDFLGALSLLVGKRMLVFA